MKGKKISTLITVLILITSMLLAGCSKPATQPITTKEEAKTETPAAPEKEQLEEVELTWYYFGSAPGKDQALVEEAMNAYLKDKINATIKLYPMGWDEFNTKTRAMIAANEAIDIVFSAKWIGFDEGVAANRWLDITEMFDQYAPETKKLMGDTWLKGGTVDGKLFAIPTIKELGHSYGFLVNKELLAKHNLSVENVKTLEDMRPLLEVIKANEPNVVPFDTSVMGVDALLPNESISGDKVLPFVTEPGSNEVIMRDELPGYMDIMKTAHDFFNKGYIPTDVATAKESLQAKRNNGQVFAFVSQLNPGSAGANSNDKVNWEAVNITPISISNDDMGGSMNSISATSKNPERAVMFLELLNTDPYLNNLLAFGIEDVHYTKVSDNIIERIADSGYSSGDQWVFANQFINYTTTSEDPNKWEIIKEFNNSSTPQRSLGFHYDMEPWIEVVGSIKLIQSEDYSSIGIQEPVRARAETAKRYEQAGAKGMLEDLNAKYNEWLNQQ